MDRSFVSFERLGEGEYCGKPGKPVSCKHSPGNEGFGFAREETPQVQLWERPLLRIEGRVIIMPLFNLVPTR